jgi:hypothetical protein
MSFCAMPHQQCARQRDANWRLCIQNLHGRSVRTRSTAPTLYLRPTNASRHPLLLSQINVHADVRKRTKFCDNGMEPSSRPSVLPRELSLGGGMSKFKEQLLANSSQVREAERRLAYQHSFIERLRASAGDTRAAEDALEVTRDILRGLYQERSQLRRKQSSRTFKDPARPTKVKLSAGRPE